MKIHKKLTKGNLLWLFTILWMVLILSFSSDPAEVSRKKSRMVLEKVEPAIEQVQERFQVNFINKNKLHFYIRKNAHMFNYFVLTTFLVLSWKASGRKGFKPYYLSWIMATIFSMLDEFYQTFIPGRSGEVRDVLVDNVGIIIALIVVGGISKWRKIKKATEWSRGLIKY